jgi:hypothetical protein
VLLDLGEFKNLDYINHSLDSSFDSTLKFSSFKTGSEGRTIDTARFSSSKAFLVSKTPVAVYRSLEAISYPLSYLKTEFLSSWYFYEKVFLVYTTL